MHINSIITHPPYFEHFPMEAIVSQKCKRCGTNQVGTSLSYRYDFLFAFNHSAYFPFALLMSVNSSMNVV